MDGIATSGARRIPKMWFDVYLRTGATPWEMSSGDLELKYNHWHDPATGRFTSTGQGTWMGGGFTGGGGGSAGGGGASGSWTGGGFTGGGGGGGSFDGGGASGSWDPPSPKKGGASASRKQRNALPLSPAAQAALLASKPGASQDRVVVRNGYSYTLDRTDRTTSATGTLTLTADPQRSRDAQASAGGSDRLKDDDGGHYIAARFNGPTDTFNHFAQNANFNRGGYRALEDGWAKDVKAGKRVYVAIASSYAGSSRRPSMINVVYFVNGLRGSRQFPNRSKVEPHGK